MAKAISLIYRMATLSPCLSETLRYRGEREDFVLRRQPFRHACANLGVGWMRFRSRSMMRNARRCAKGSTRPSVPHSEDQALPKKMRALMDASGLAVNGAA